MNSELKNRGKDLHVLSGTVSEQWMRLGIRVAEAETMVLFYTINGVTFHAASTPDKKEIKKLAHIGIRTL